MNIWVMLISEHKEKEYYTRRIFVHKHTQQVHGLASYVGIVRVMLDFTVVIATSTVNIGVVTPGPATRRACA